MSTPYDRKEPHLRIQKSRNGKFVMYVLVWWDKDGNKKQRYFSSSFYSLHAYVNSQTKAYFIYGEEMIDKEDKRYKEYIKQRDLIRKNLTKIKPQKKTAISAQEAKDQLKQIAEDVEDNPNDPITTRIPLKL